MSLSSRFEKEKSFVKFRCLFVYFLLFVIQLKATAQTDTAEISRMIATARSEFSKDPQLSARLARKALHLSGLSQQQPFIAKACNTLGSAFYFLSAYDSAEYYHRKALEIQEELNDEVGIGRSYTNIGSIYSDKGLNDKAIQYFLIAEKKFAATGFKAGQARLNNSLGILFYNIKDYKNAIAYFRQGMKLAAELKDEVLEYSISINLANALGDAGQLRSAIDIYKSAYAIAKKNNNYTDLAIVCNNICQTYLSLNDLYLAPRYDREAMELIRTHRLEDYLKVLAYTNHAIILQNSGDYKHAAAYLEEAAVIADQTDELVKRVEIYRQLSQTAKKDKDYLRSITALEKANRLSDSMYTKNLQEKLSELNAVHNVEKKEKEIGLLNAARRHQQLVTVLLIVVIVISLAALAVVIYSYLRKKKDNTLISSQKKEVEQKNKVIGEKQREIIDSITYARGLQEAILPPITYWSEHLPDSFILYQPKDIVAGDFYWMETLSPQPGKTLVFFAVADCTGHGVPGAMVSMVCSTALNRSVLEFRLEQPGEILDKTRELLIGTFRKSSTEIKDGMDVSLCCFDPASGKLHWSGANNPLWLIRDGDLIEIKADKQPIGKYDLQKNFLTHSFYLGKGDLLYLFTDGFADQFGGPDGKKFKYKQLKELLISIHALPMPQQKQQLLNAFTNWKQELDQVDDVCIVGVRI